MFSFLGDAFNSISNTASTISWSDVAMDAIGTAVVGAGVGALIGAVGGGSVSDGLLFGATGGLVAGGLGSFGKQFFDNWEWSSAEQMASTQMSDADLAVLKEANIVPDAVTGAAPKMTGSSTEVFINQTKPGQSSSLASFWGPEATAAALKVGGSMLAGAFTEDPQAKMLEMQQANTKRAREAVRSFASNQPTRGGFTSGVSVREQAANKEATGFSKEGSGVHV